MPERKSILDRIRAMSGDGDAAARLDLESLISELESERQMMTGMISDLREMNGLASAWDQAANVLENGITELEQDIEAARQELEAITAAGVDDPYKGERRARQALAKGWFSDWVEGTNDTNRESRAIYDRLADLVDQAAHMSDLLGLLRLEHPEHEPIDPNVIHEARAAYDAIFERASQLIDEYNAAVEREAERMADGGGKDLAGVIDGLERAA